MPRPLRHDEARARAETLAVSGYQIHLDLVGSVETFESQTTIEVHSSGGETFLDLQAAHVKSVKLDGIRLADEAVEDQRLALDLSPGPHRIDVHATMRFRNDGEGLHRTVDPTDGQAYLYAMSFMDAAPSIFACFDQPDLKAPVSLTVQAPEEWVVFANGRGDRGGAGLWEFETTQPLSTYFVTLVAGPYATLEAEHDGIRLSLSARHSLREALERDAPDILTVTGQCLDEFHRLFGIRYPFGDYHQAFVPEFNAGAMENPGCVTLRDQLIFDRRATRGDHISRATTIAHEMAHQWFGNLVTPRWWDDLWLNESFAEYMGNRVTADVTQYTDAWAHNSWARRQWGLRTDSYRSTHPIAGNPADDAHIALANFDGISYAKGSNVLKQLAAQVGDEVFLAGVRDHFTAHRFGNATMDDLIGAWRRAGAQDLDAFVDSWLLSAGVDEVRFDRARGEVVCVPAAESSTARTHAIDVAVLTADGDAELQAIKAGVQGVDVGASGPVVLDPHEVSWAHYPPDEVTMDGLVEVAGRIKDRQLLAATWNNIRSGWQLGRVAPDDIVRLASAAPPVTDTRDGPGHTGAWLSGEVVPLATVGGRERLLGVYLDVLDRAASGTDEQLLALCTAIRLSGRTEGERLFRWRTGALPDGLDLDTDLRWRLNARLAALGAMTREELDTELESEPSVTAQAHHAGAVASMPTQAAKQFAWDRFTGAVAVPNHELTAAGGAMWQRGQEALTNSYIEAYANQLVDVSAERRGWVLNSSTKAFFPTTLDSRVATACTPLETNSDLPAEVRRAVADSLDQWGWLMAIKNRYAS